MQEHREEFEPFVEDEVPFEEYCSTMREDGTWAGNMELQATSLVTGCNICIHQVQSHALCFAAEGFVEDN
jgi:OTU domain-containing protein 3